MSTTTTDVGTLNILVVHPLAIVIQPTIIVIKAWGITYLPPTYPVHINV